jgi:ribosome-binding ATPase YchF (GTP1/OBG family)
MDEDQNNISAEIIDASEQSSEPIDIPSEVSTIEKELDEEDTQLEKPRKPRTEAQKTAFAKAQKALKEKRELKKKEAMLNKKPRGRPPKKKTVDDSESTMINKVNESVMKGEMVIEDEDSSDEEEHIVIKTKTRKAQRKKKPVKRKKKIIYISESESSESETESESDEEYINGQPQQQQQFNPWAGIRFV